MGKARIKYNADRDRRVPGGRILAFIKTLLNQGCEFTVDYRAEYAVIEWRYV